jgi:pimeloyl-ACP methyl ester carboxylesterase
MLVPDIYCFPGIGVDGRLFSGLDLSGYNVKHIHWILPHKKEKLEDYALRLSSQIDRSRPFVLIGVSFGGMICSALASHLHPERVFLISSSKCRAELPLRVRILKIFPFYLWFSDKAYVRAATLSRRMFGFKGKEDAKLFEEMLNTPPNGYFRRATDCVVRWSTDTFESGIVHIHGTNDLVIPISSVKPDYIIQGGSHNMMMTKAAEISMIIRNELQKQVNPTVPSTYP